MNGPHVSEFAAPRRSFLESLEIDDQGHVWPLAANNWTV